MIRIPTPDKFLLFPNNEFYEENVIGLIIFKLQNHDFESYLTNDNIKYLNLHRYNIPKKILQSVCNRFNKRGWNTKVGIFHAGARGPFEGIAFSNNNKFDGLIQKY